MEERLEILRKMREELKLYREYLLRLKLVIEINKEKEDKILVK